MFHKGGWSQHLSGTAPASVPSGGHDRPWQAHLYPQSERVAAAARVPVVLVSAGWWLFVLHGRPATLWGVPVLAVAALALVWSMAMAAVVYRRPSLFERAPMLSVATDLVLVGVWLAAAGSHAAVFLPAVILGAASAATRVPLLAGTLSSVAFAAVAIVFGGWGALLIALYTTIFGTALSVFAAAVQQDRLQSLRDPLTGVFSRRYGLYQLQMLLRTHQVPFCLGLLDLDGFKDINDRYGHLVGDQVLAALATVMQSSLRQGDDVVRMGGDEFMLILPLTTLTGAHVVAERLREVLAESRITAIGTGQPVRATASIGLVEATEGMSPHRLIERADACLYEAKRQRNAVVTDRAV